MLIQRPCCSESMLLGCGSRTDRVYRRIAFAGKPVQSAGAAPLLNPIEGFRANPLRSGRLWRCPHAEHVQTSMMFANDCLCHAVQHGQPASGKGYPCWPSQHPPSKPFRRIALVAVPFSLCPRPPVESAGFAAAQLAPARNSTALTIACFCSRATVVVRASAEGDDTRRAVRGIWMHTDLHTPTSQEHTLWIRQGVHFSKRQLGRPL